MMILLIVFIICLVIMGICVLINDDAGFTIFTAGAVFFGVITAVGAVMIWVGVPGVAW